MKELIISIKIPVKGKDKGKFKVNIKEEGTNAHGFILYAGTYSKIEFNNKLWQAAGDKA